MCINRMEQRGPQTRLKGCGFLSSGQLDRHSRLPIASTIAMGLLILVGGCRGREAPRTLPPAQVTVARPVEKDVIEWDEYTGYLEAVDFADVRARVSGFVERAPFLEGSLVQKGQLLYELDVRPFQAELDSRLADVQRAEAQVAFAQIEVSRLRQLMPAQAASPIEAQSAEAVLRQRNAELAGAKAAVELARLNVEWCHVTAPISGRVSRKSITPGNLITGGGGSATMLTTIASLDPIYCEFEVDERSALKYQRLVREKKRPSAREGRVPCLMQLANETNFPHQGVINFVDNRIDPTTGTIRLRGVFANPQGWLEPGFFARVRLPGSGIYRALLVPDGAVVTNQSEKSLLVAGPDDVVGVRPVKLGALFGELRAIKAGIGPDDRVIVSGMMRAQPGVKVAPHETTISTASVLPLALAIAQALSAEAAATAPAASAPASSPASAPAESRGAP